MFTIGKVVDVKPIWGRSHYFTPLTLYFFFASCNNSFLFVTSNLIFTLTGVWELERNGSTIRRWP